MDIETAGEAKKILLAIERAQDKLHEYDKMPQEPNHYNVSIRFQNSGSAGCLDFGIPDNKSAKKVMDLASEVLTGKKKAEIADLKARLAAL